MSFTKQRLDYKLASGQLTEKNHFGKKYDKSVRQMMANSTDTFTNLQTPGWSSLVKSQISDRKKNNATSNYQQILARINKMKGTSFKENQNFKNVSAKPLNLKQKSHKSINTHTLQSQYINQQDNHCNYANLNQNQKTVKHPKLIKGRSYTSNHFGKSQRNSDTKQNTLTCVTKTKGKNSIQKDAKNTQRWNQISVHQHLYLHGKHMDNKKMIARIIDEQYQKKQILKFKPEINQKSIYLAQSRFSRVKQKLDYELTPQKKDQLKQIPQEDNQKSSRLRKAQQDKQNKDVEKYKLLNKCFYFLSSGNYQLNQKLLHQKIEQLPFSCIKTLHPILQKVYSGSTLQWTQFLSMFNSKQINNRQGFFVVFARWLKKNQVKNQYQEDQKQIKN